MRKNYLDIPNVIEKSDLGLSQSPGDERSHLQYSCPIAIHAHNHPDAPGIVTEQKTFSYLELHQQTHSLVLALARQKVAPGTRVAFFATSHIATALLLFALFRLKAIACPLTPKIPQRQLPTNLNHLKATHFYLPEELPWETRVSCPDIPESAPSSLATFLFTSGSTDKPKIACHSWNNHYYSALGAIDAIALKSHSLYHLSLPLFHVSGLAILFRCMIARSPLLISSFPLEVALSTYPITHLSLVPTQLYRLVETTSPPPSLQCALLGGAPAALSLLAKAAAWPVYLTYGMTEMSSMISLKGQVLPFREVKIENKEIYVRGNTLFQGYLDHPPLQEGWFATNDLGYFDGNRLVITGRKDRQFISGGENIQPEEIERALTSLPYITKARVVPKEDPEFGQRPCAYIEGTSYELKEIREALSLVLPSFKLPVEIYPFGNLKEKEF